MIITDKQKKLTELSGITANNIIKDNNFYTQKGFKGFLKRFFSFAGRIGRITFCLRLLAIFASLVMIYTIDVFLIRSVFWVGIGAIIINLMLFVFAIIWTVLSFVSGLSLMARRLHDFNFSTRGVMLFTIFDVIFGITAMFLGFNSIIFWLILGVVFLVLMLIPGTKGKNRYGFRNLKAMLSEFD